MKFIIPTLLFPLLAAAAPTPKEETKTNPPFTVLGFAPTLFVVGAGVAVLAVFVRWERRRDALGADPLMHLALLRRPVLRAGLLTLLSQNLILLGLFFTIPLYLQVVQGFDAFETGLRLLPVSVTMLVASLCGSPLARVAGPRLVVRLALATLASFRGGAPATLAVLGYAVGLVSFLVIDHFASRLATRATVHRRARSEAARGRSKRRDPLDAGVGIPLILDRASRTPA